MAKTRDVLVHVAVEEADRQRKCHHRTASHNIPRKSKHLAIKGGPYGARKNYCIACAGPILEKAHNKIADLKKDLGIP